MKNKIHKETKAQGGASPPPPPAGDLYRRINGFFERYQHLFFVVSIVQSVLMCILLFDVKVSLSGDDCDYILGAVDLWRHFTYPGGHGAVLYQALLAPFAGISGMNLILLKSLSALCIIASVWLFYKTFRGAVPAAVLIPALMLVSLCSYVFFYASYTYSEAFFMLMQGLFIYFFAGYFLRGDPEAGSRPGAVWGRSFALAALALGLILSRPVGFGLWGAVILFFAIRRRWKDLLYLLGAFAVLYAAFGLLRSALWPGTGGTIQFSSFVLKDPYNPSQGTEDFAGLVSRFAQNSLIYLSSFLYRFMGLLPDSPSNVVHASWVRCLLTYLLYAGCLAIVFRRNHTLLFIGLYAGVMNFVSFAVLQSSWGQDRLILIYYPFILLLFLGGIYYLLRIRILRKGFFIYPVLLLVLLAGTLSTTKGRVEKNLPVLQQNLLGDPLYGLTPDWENFIKGSRWAAKNLPREAVIVSRKPTISKVYTGRDFTTTPGSLAVPTDVLAALKANLPDGLTLLVGDIGKGVFTGEAVRYLVIPHISRSSEFVLDGSRSTQGVCVYAVPDESLALLTDGLAKYQMIYTLDYDDFLEQCRRMEYIYIYDPDVMLRYLEEQGIDYLLLPQLRVYPQKNTGNFINSVHLYREVISFKYPDRFRTVHTTGDTEPCEIVEFIRRAE